jgi:hemoglobin-like flavoprotein
MTADQLLAIDLPFASAPPSERSALAETVRSSFARVERRADELAASFYATLFARAPQTRAMFPVNMQVQRSRLLRALVHVVQMVDQPDELIPFLEQLGRDHRKFGVVAEHYDTVGHALLTAMAEVAGPAWTDDVRKAWTEAYCLAAEAMRAAAGAETGPICWPARIVGHRRIGWDLAVVTVRPAEPVPYRAGQYVSVETPQRPRLWRYLSPANAPRPDATMEFHVRAVRGGWVSQAIVAHAMVGDTWHIGPPMGRMRVDSASRELLMIAGGTGYAPVGETIRYRFGVDGVASVQAFAMTAHPIDRVARAVRTHDRVSPGTPLLTDGAGDAPA